MAIAQRTKIVTKDLGDPSIIKLQPENVRKMMLGTIIGVVTGFCERGNPKDPSEKFEGLVGSFRSIPADPTRDELESGVCFLPDAFHNMISTPFKSMVANDKNAQLRFAFEISAIRATNPQGYSWEFLPKIEAVGGNPLDALLEDLGELKTVEGKRVLAIAGPAKPAAAASAKK